MCVLPSLPQAQLSAAIAIIGKSDFPHAWEELLPYVVSKVMRVLGLASVADGVLVRRW